MGELRPILKHMTVEMINAQVQQHTEEPLLVNKETFQLQMHKHILLNVQVVRVLHLMSLMINANGNVTYKASRQSPGTGR